MHDSHADTSKETNKAFYFNNKVINNDLLCLQLNKIFI